MPEFQPPSELEKILALRQREAEQRRQRETELDTHVQAIRQAQDDLEKAALTLQGCCQLLHRSVRTASNDPAAANFRAFALVQVRMAGAINSALVRSRAANKLIDSAKAVREEEEQRLVQENLRARVREIRQDVVKLHLPQSDDLEFLYEEEDTVNASQ